MPNGWRPLPRSDPRYSPTKRLYLSPSNEVTSRRQYDNARLQGEGWESKSDFDRRYTLRRNRGYDRWLEAASENLDIPRSELAKADSDFNAAFLAARDDGFSKNAHGTFAEFLEFIGVRQEGADYDVGDSP